MDSIETIDGIGGIEGISAPRETKVFRGAVFGLGLLGSIHGSRVCGVPRKSDSTLPPAVSEYQAEQSLVCHVQVLPVPVRVSCFRRNGSSW